MSVKSDFTSSFKMVVLLEKMASPCVCSLLILFSLLLCKCSSEIIEVHPAGVCTSGANEMPTPAQQEDCFSLDEALAMLSSNDEILLGSGTHVLTSFAIENVVRDLHHVRIKGNSSSPKDVVITCLDSVGLFFYNMTDFAISGVTIEQCGLKGVQRIDNIFGVIRETIDLIYYPLPDFSVALLVADAHEVNLTDVTIRNNRGFGLVGINVMGDVNLLRVNVMQNYPSECVLRLVRYSEVGGSGGGLFFLYQDYNDVELVEENHHEFNLPDLLTHFRYRESYVGDNYACRIDLFNNLHDRLPRSIKRPLSVDTSMLGAGGMTIVLAQASYIFHGLIESNIFHNNSGTYNGAGLTIAQYESNNQTRVVLRDCNFSQNGEELVRRYGDQGLGPSGAIMLKYYVPYPTNLYNTLDATAKLLSQEAGGILITNCSFNNNTAVAGGGIYVISYGPEIDFVQDKLSIENSIFAHNRGFLGGALYFNELDYNGLNQGIRISLSNISVTNNFRHGMSVGNSISTGTGIIHINFVNVTMAGHNEISYNQDTGIALHTAVITFSGSLLMKSNRGTNGGAISVSDESYIVLRNGVNATFYQNSALIAGGAIYVEFDITRAEHYNCFIFFDEINFYCDLLNQCNINRVSVNLINNTAPLGIAIYGSTFTNCPWLGGNYLAENDLSAEVIVNLLLKFEPYLFIRPLMNTTTNVINTLPKHIETSPNTNPYFEVMPGQEFMIMLGAFDQLNQAIPLTIFSRAARVDGEDAKHSVARIGATNRYLLTAAHDHTPVPVRVFGLENAIYNVSIVSNEALVEYTFLVKLGQCLAGFVYDSASLNCTCKADNYISEVECSNNGTISVPVGNWIGLFEENRYAYSECIFDYCDPATTGGIFLDAPDLQCSSNRSGILCGRCQEGFSRTLGISSCEKCTNIYLLLILPFALAGLLLVILIFVLNITITDGYINGIIFYSNILSLYVHSATFSSFTYHLDLPRTIVSFLNLNLGVRACFYDGATDLHLTFLYLAFPLYLGLILMLITLFTKYVHSKHLTKLLSKFNITHVFATLLVLTYTSIVRTCVDALSLVRVSVSSDFTTNSSASKSITRWRIDPNQAYFSGLHIVLFFVAIFFLLLLLPFPILLLFPHLSLRLLYIKRLKPLIDAFTAPLADGRTFWIGFRILCRTAFFLVSLFESKTRNLVLSVFIAGITLFEAYIKPFKTKTRNLLDLFVMANLSLMSVLFTISNYENDMNDQVVYAIITLLCIYCSVVLLILVSYIVVAIPYTKILLQKTTKYGKEKMNAISSYQFFNQDRKLGSMKKRRSYWRPRRSGRNQVTSTSVRMHPRQEADNFESLSYLGFRESVFNEPSDPL